MMFFIIVLGVLTGIYTMIGGLLAVVWTESIQTVLLLIGAVCITAVGYHYVGGWEALKATLASHPHPLAAATDAKIACNWSTGDFLSILRGPSDPSKQPWLGILLGYPVIGIWYWCCDQTIVQRVLAAKDDKTPGLGPLFCAFLKILPVFLFVLPGVFCVALVSRAARCSTANHPRRRSTPIRSWSRTCCPGAEGAGHGGHAGGRDADLFGRA